MHITDSLPDGFYLLKNSRDPSVSLVKLYAHEDFGGVRHIAFGPWDGAALMPVTDLCADSVLTPAIVAIGEVPANNLDGLLPHNAGINARRADG